MATGTGAATMQPAAAAASAIHQQGNDMQAAFDAMHGELVAEAHAVATEFGVDVRTVAFRPDGGGGCDSAQPLAVAHEFLGSPPEVRARKMIRRLAAKDVSGMGAAELAPHAARLRALRAAVVRKLREKEEKKNAAAVGGEGTVKRAPGQEQETLAAGSTKIRRIE